MGGFVRAYHPPGGSNKPEHFRWKKSIGRLPGGRDLDKTVFMRLIIRIGIFLALIALGWSGWWVFGRTPLDQVLAAQAKFIAAVEDRDFDEVKSMLTDDYADDYGHNRDSAVEDVEQALGGFITLTITQEIVKTQVVPDLAMVKAKMRMEGKGLSAINGLVVAHVNQIQEPWDFHWHKKGRWPWDWKIVQIHNNELHIPQ